MMSTADLSGRPESGAGSVAGIGTRLKAFIVDSLLSVAIALLAGFKPGEAGYDVTVWASFLGIELLFVAGVGQTPGMRVAGAAVVRASDSGRAKLRWVAVRTVLLATVLPALIVDVTGRAMHDRAAGTVMIRTR
jgi:uncharacterized RDD family membrane protein YckC